MSASRTLNSSRESPTTCPFLVTIAQILSWLIGAILLPANNRLHSSAVTLPPACRESKVSMYSSGASTSASNDLTRLPRPALFFFEGVKPQGESLASPESSPNMLELEALEGVAAAASSSNRVDLAVRWAGASSSPKRDMLLVGLLVRAWNSKTRRIAR